MALNRDTAGDEAANRFHDGRAAFELDRLRSAHLDELRRAGQRLLRADLVRHKRKVGDHERPTRPADHGLGVMDDIAKGDRNGVLERSAVVPTLSPTKMTGTPAASTSRAVG